VRSGDLIRTLVLLLAALQADACGTRSTRPTFPGATPPVVVPPPGTPLTSNVVETALSLRGIPYRAAGTSPSGFDCSGFVQYVFAQHGVFLPREVSEQYRAGHQIRKNELKPGDLVFFQTERERPSHVGIVIGEGEFVHAPSSRGVVRIERFDTRYWEPRFTGARRVS